MNEQAIRGWIEEQIPAFHSASEFASRAGITPSTLDGVRKSGHAKPETLKSLGEAVGWSAKQMFILAGWLSPEPTDLPHDQAEFLAIYQGLHELPRLQRMLLVETQLIARGLRELHDEAVLEPGWTP